MVDLFLASILVSTAAQAASEPESGPALHVGVVIGAGLTRNGSAYAVDAADVIEVRVCQQDRIDLRTLVRRGSQQPLRLGAWVDQRTAPRLFTDRQIGIGLQGPHCKAQDLQPSSMSSRR